MATFAGRATLADGTEVPYSGDAPPRKTLKLGLTYPTDTGESQTAATQRLFTEFPGAKMFRVFRGPGDALPSWGSSAIAAIPNHVDIVISMKDWAPQSYYPWFDSFPAARKAAGAKLYFAYQHEFDQWQSASNTKGRPDPVTWLNRMDQLLDEADGQPWRPWVRIGAVYMEYGLRTRDDWHDLWGLTSSRPDILRRVDWHGPDCYNLAPLRYRPGGEMFQQPLELAADCGGKEVLVAEWGHARRDTSPDFDSDGTKCAAVMRGHVDFLRAQTIAPVIGACWYYNHDNVLSEPALVARGPEYAALLGMINGG